MKLSKIGKINSVLLLILISLFSLKAQPDSIPQKNFRNNILKLSILPVFQSLSGNNEKWIGIEYERFINQRMSVSALVDAGLFEDYTYIKYYDYFNESGGFYSIQQQTKTKGYHFIPSFKYYVFTTKQKKGQGFYAAGNLDFNQYFSESEYYNSRTTQTEYTNFSTTRTAIGLTLGGQYVAFSRLTIDLNIAVFTRIFTITNGQETEAIPPLNATWTFNDNNSWSTVNLMIGYAFGGGKRK